MSISCGTSPGSPFLFQSVFFLLMPNEHNNPGVRRAEGGPVCDFSVGGGEERWVCGPSVHQPHGGGPGRCRHRARLDPYQPAAWPTGQGPDQKGTLTEYSCILITIFYILVV